MADRFKAKSLLEVSEINERAKKDNYIEWCENEYSARLRGIADEVTAHGAKVIMLSGPSASGKTTSAKKLAVEFMLHGINATVVSLDDFFIEVDRYPRSSDGTPDMEHVGALNIERIHTCLNEVIETGKTVMPQFDFIKRRPGDEEKELIIGGGDILIVEGIHALNPLLLEGVRADKIFKIYAGLRTEYAEDGKRIISTREIRIIRRLIRDYYFRGNSVRNTLEYWHRILEGEKKWIKPFKVNADMLLNTSLEYEPCVTIPILSLICEDETQGEDYRPVLLRLQELFRRFEPMNVANVPKNSVIREFYGGLQL